MEQIEQAIGHEFRDKELLEEALTHPSISKTCLKTGMPFNYERLEFLGDSVLGLVIAELIINKYPQEKEGALAKRQAGLVRGEAVAKVAEKIGIGKFIRMTPGEEAMGGRKNSSNMENALEAVIGAVYMDGGMEDAKSFIEKHWTKLVEEMKEPPKDPKTTLQEWAQGKGLPIPEYVVVSSSGPSHSPDFKIEVRIKGLEPVAGEGSSKKKAEKEAAKEMLELIAKNEK